MVATEYMFVSTMMNQPITGGCNHMVSYYFTNDEPILTATQLLCITSRIVSLSSGSVFNKPRITSLAEQCNNNGNIYNDTSTFQEARKLMT